MANEKRLIDANALLDTVLKHFGVDLTYFGEDLQFCQEAIQFAPTVDAVEVVHGRWEWDGKHFCCSACAGTRFHDLVLGLDAAYCPYCGAKMDGGKDNE